MVGCAWVAREYCRFKLYSDTNTCALTWLRWTFYSCRSFPSLVGFFWNGVAADHIAPAEALYDDDGDCEMTDLPTVNSARALASVSPPNLSGREPIEVTEVSTAIACLVNAPVSAPVCAALSIIVAPESIAVETFPSLNISPPRLLLMRGRLRRNMLKLSPQFLKSLWSARRAL